MSFLHSFYGWGSLLVIACTTLLFRLIGIENWTWVAFMWALLPICNAISFCRVPIAKVVEDGQGLTLGQLFRQKIFWAFALVMICSGASELAMSQWASAFAESGLHVSKTVGDLAGPCFFAACMGISRVMHAKLSGRIRLETYMMVCGILCSLSYLLAILPLPPMVNLLGCGFCGLSVGVMWPGTCSLASQHCPRGGIAMFGMLALFGDVGCSTGPTVVGLVSNLFRENLKVGLGAAMIFPLLIVLSVYLITKKDPVKK